MWKNSKTFKKRSQKISTKFSQEHLEEFPKQIPEEFSVGLLQESPREFIKGFSVELLKKKIGGNPVESPSGTSEVILRETHRAILNENLGGSAGVSYMISKFLKIKH